MSLYLKCSKMLYLGVFLQSDSAMQKLHFTCIICRRVPCDPFISKCSNIFSKECIFGWFSLSSACPVCPVCRSLLDESEVSPLHSHLLQIDDTLLVHCIHANCTQSQLIRNIDKHESICSIFALCYNKT